MKNAHQHRPFLHIILIIFLSLIAYSNTFESSFHFDDEHYIVNNPVIKDLRNFIEPSSSSDFSIQFKRKTLQRRYIGYLTFALNYRLHGLNVAGYHFVNLFIHIGTALLVYFFILLTFKTPYLRSSAIKDFAGHIALFTALLFACHPLQTQAVTYIWQRVTSLCTLFYLLSLVAYIKWRLSYQLTVDSSQMTEKNREGGGRIFYVISIISAVLAMKTKEIAFMIPVMLLLYEFIFFGGKIKKRALYLIPFIMSMLIIPLTTISGELTGDLDKLIKGSTQLPRGEYLLAEFRVLVTYLRLIFLPVNQNLDYDYSRYYSFFNVEVFSSFVFLAFIFGLSVYILFRYRDSVPHTRLISFGIIWFFITLLLESSVIPLNNVIFEHRMYLPSVGVYSASAIAIFMAMNRWKAYAKLMTAMLAVIIIVLTGATYARNAVWKDELTLWQDVVNKSPNKARGYNNLGNAYRDQTLIERAIENYRLALNLDPDFPEPYFNLGHAYQTKGKIDDAITHYQKYIKFNPVDSDAYNNLGNAYRAKGSLDKAIEQYLIALKLNPYYGDSRINLGNAYMSQGLIDMAIEQYRIAITFRRYMPDTYFNLGNAYKSKGLIDKAIENYRISIELEPHVDSYTNLCSAYHSKGLLNKALEQCLAAITLDSEDSPAHNSLGNVYMSLRDFDKAIEHFRLAITFKPDYPEAHHNLGNAYMLQDLPEKAVKEYGIAIKQNPGDYNVYYSLGDAYKFQGISDKAKESYKTARELQKANGIQH